MAADKQKVILILALITETCTASKAALDRPQSSESTAPDLSLLRKDFLSILTLLYTLTTKVSLTLRPEQSAYSASLAPLQDLSKYISSLTTCATLFDPHGKTLSEDVKSSAKDVLESIKAFSAAFTNIVEQGEATAEDYLVKTGTVHDAIDQVRRGLPEDNVAAVRRRWLKDREMLEDSLAEVDDMIESGGAGEGDDDDDDGDGFDDEWNELGLGATKRMTAEELERTKKIHPLLRMVVLMHKRVLLDVLKNAPVTSNSVLDTLPQQSHSLLVAFEELMAALYAPQDPSAMKAALAALGDDVTKLKAVLLEGSLLTGGNHEVNTSDADSLQKKMAAVSVSGPTHKKSTDVRKWFDTCFGQISKLVQTVTSSLDLESSSS